MEECNGTPHKLEDGDRVQWSQKKNPEKILTRNICQTSPLIGHWDIWRIKRFAIFSIYFISRWQAQEAVLHKDKSQGQNLILITLIISLLISMKFSNQEVMTSKDGVIRTRKMRLQIWWWEDLWWTTIRLANNAGEGYSDPTQCAGLIRVEVKKPRRKKMFEMETVSNKLVGYISN